MSLCGPTLYICLTRFCYYASLPNVINAPVHNSIYKCAYFSSLQKMELIVNRVVLHLSAILAHTERSQVSLQ